MDRNSRSMTPSLAGRLRGCQLPVRARRQCQWHHHASAAGCRHAGWPRRVDARRRRLANLNMRTQHAPNPPPSGTRPGPLGFFSLSPFQRPRGPGSHLNPLVRHTAYWPVARLFGQDNLHRHWRPRSDWLRPKLSVPVTACFTRHLRKTQVVCRLELLLIDTSKDALPENRT